MPTIDDVAKYAGVSHGTASKVINNVPGVSSKKIEQVQKAIEALGYQPNIYARGLKTKKIQQIELVLPTLLDKAMSDLYDSIYWAAKADGYSLLYNHISEIIQQGFTNIALITLSSEYSFEADCRSAYLNAILDKNLPLHNEYIISTNSDSHSSTLAALRLLQSDEPPQAIYTTNSMVASGVEYAIELLNSNSDHKPLLISLDSASWEKLPSPQRIFLSYSQMGLEAYSLIKRSNQSKTKLPVSAISLNSQKQTARAPQTYVSSIPKKELRFLLKPFLADSNSSLMLQACLNRLEQEQGIKVNIDFVDSNTLNEVFYAQLLESCKTGSCDLFTADIPMLSPLEKEGFLLHLDNYTELKELVTRIIPKNILTSYGMLNKKLVAIPFSFTTQLLLYRKDLFNNSRLQRLYFEMFKEELAPPKTWKEYNQIARFFTRSFNPDSPTMYGSTFFVAEGVELLPRFWSLSKKKTRFTKESLKSPAFAEAIGYLLELCSYTPNPEFITDNIQWGAQTNAFRQGEIAMMSTFADWAYDLNYSSSSELMGNLGYTLLPGKYSIQGGWSCAVNPNSPNRDAALTVLKWLCSEKLLLPNAIGGRFFPHKALEENSELYALFPWYKTMTEAFNYTIPRPVIESENRSSALPRTFFYEIIDIIQSCYQKNLPLDATLAIIKKSIK